MEEKCMELIVFNSQYIDKVSLFVTKLVTTSPATYMIQSVWAVLSSLVSVVASQIDPSTADRTDRIATIGKTRSHGLVAATVTLRYANRCNERDGNWGQCRDTSHVTEWARGCHERCHAIITCHGLLNTLVVDLQGLFRRQNIFFHCILLHPMTEQGSPWYHKVLTIIPSYFSKVTPIGALHAEKIADAVLCYVSTI